MGRAPVQISSIKKRKTIAAICKGKGIIASPTSIRRILHEEGLIAHATVSTLRWDRRTAEPHP